MSPAQNTPGRGAQCSAHGARAELAQPGGETRPRGPLAPLHRQLAGYPDTPRRLLYLALTVAGTIVLYYELYVQGAVSTKIIQAFGFSFTDFVLVLVVGNAIGAFASLFAGLADRWGRANLVVFGLLASGLLIEFALPNATGRWEYYLFFGLLSLVEGMALVATPALIRDFSPQLGRGAAMAFWTMGPVLGSLLVTEISSHTLTAHPDWQYQFRLCGIVGLGVWLVSFLALRELSPKLRDQLMVSMRDRALVEARAAGIDPDAMLEGQWRQMLVAPIVGSALAISIFLMLYYVFVAFLVVYFATVFGYSEARANALGNWYWIANAIALLLAGLASDLLRVRKPFMLFGGLLGAAGVALFAIAATEHGTGYHTFAAYFLLIAAGGGVAYVAWMAGFTETVERRNPAATATGLAVWGWVLRIVVTITFAILPAIVPATGTLVDHGPRVQAIAAAYPAQVRTLGNVRPATLKALSADPRDTSAQAAALSELSHLPVATVASVTALSRTYARQIATAAAISPVTLRELAVARGDTALQERAASEIAARLHIATRLAAARLAALAQVPLADLAALLMDGPPIQAAAARLRALAALPKADLAYLQANGSQVRAAQRDTAGQWQAWWWVCFAAQLLFVPLIFLMGGRWSPRRARRDEREHELFVEQELARLRAASAGRPSRRAA